jgi:diguanylate cyclase (GGDEF)-like protein
MAAVIGENAFRPADLSARYGGEEFAIVMPETDHEGPRKVVERLRDGVARLRLSHGAPGVGPPVTLSIGIATQIPTEGVCSEWPSGRPIRRCMRQTFREGNRVVFADKVLATFARAGGERDRQPAAGSERDRTPQTLIGA